MKKNILLVIVFSITLGVASCTSKQERMINAWEKAYMNDDEAAKKKIGDYFVAHSDDFTDEQKERILDIMLIAAENRAARNYKSFHEAWNDGDVRKGMTYEQISAICGDADEINREDGEVFFAGYYSEGVMLWFYNGRLNHWND